MKATGRAFEKFINGMTSFAVQRADKGQGTRYRLRGKDTDA